MSVTGSARGAIPVKTAGLRLSLAPNLCPNVGGRTLPFIRTQAAWARADVASGTLFSRGEVGVERRFGIPFGTQFDGVFDRDNPSETIRRVISQPFLDTWSWTEHAGVSLRIDLRHTMLILLVLFVASAWEVS